MTPKNANSERRLEAEPLRQSLLDAFAALQLAQLKHEHALEIAADAGPLNADGITALRQAGREYAAAVSQYTNAAMAWLSFVDLHVEEAKEFARKRAAGTA